MIKLGLDFDNTLITYDELFKKAAFEKELIPNDFPENKNLIRNYLRKKNQEILFTLLQGEIYGRRISEATQAEGMYAALKKAKNNGIELFIISHKTKTPYKGPKYDLHHAALTWLEKNLFFNEDGINIPKQNIFFEETKEKKIQRIEELKCSHFIDDLPEILNLINPKVERILYKAEEDFKKYAFKIMHSWSDLVKILN